MTIKCLAKELFDQLELKTRIDGTDFFSLKSHEKWMIDVCRKAHGEFMPNDYVYKAIVEALDCILGASGESESDIKESVFANNQIEAEIYNNDLLAWVSNNLYFAQYVDTALTELHFKSLFEALSRGNQIFKEDIFNSVLDSLSNLTQESEKN